MTVSNQSVRFAYEGNGATVSFAFTFPVQSADDLLVMFRDSSDVESELVNGVDYSTTLLGGGASGGSIALSSIVPLAGEFVSLILRPPVTQEFDVSAGNTITPEDFEAALDKLTNLLKYAILDQADDRALRLTEGAVHSETTHAFDAGSHIISNVTDPVADQDVATKAYVAAAVLAAEITPGTISSLSAFSATRLADATAAAWLTGLGVSAFWQAVLDETGLANTLTAMGFSTVVKNILQDTTAGAILTELGLTALAQSLISQSTTAAARGVLEVEADIYKKNEVINGDFQVAQLGTTFSAPADDSYCYDQWIYLYDTAGASPVDLTRPNTSGPNYGKAYMHATVRAGGANRKFAFLQPFETQAAVPLRSKTVSASIAIRANGDLTGFKLYLVEWAGAADTITSDLVSAWNAATTDFTPIANWSVAGSVVIAATTSWQTYTLQGVTLSGGLNNLGLLVVTHDSGWSDAQTVDFSEALLVRGSYAVPFRPRALNEEVGLCERFYEKTFPLETAPATAAGNPGCLVDMARNTGGSPGLAASWTFRARKRATPSTINTYAPLDAFNGWGLVGAAGTTFAATVAAAGQNGVGFYGSAAAASGSVFGLHATADARL